MKYARRFIWFLQKNFTANPLTRSDVMRRHSVEDARRSRELFERRREEYASIPMTTDEQVTRRDALLEKARAKTEQLLAEERDG